MRRWPAAGNPSSRYSRPVPGEEFEVAVEGGLLRGSVAGQGDPVLLLHGGPGLPWTYLQPLVDELAGGNLVAVYQQRGLPPSTAGAPYDLPIQVADVVAVLDGLAWERVVVAGHSWGGHLLLYLLAEHPERVSAALVIDPLGGVGDGGEAEFDAEMMRRTPASSLARVEHLEEQAMAGRGTDADLEESMQLLWPAYFADPSAAPSFPDMAFSLEAYAATFASLHDALPGLASRLAGVAVPTLFVHGAASPMPVTASTETAEAIGPAASVEVLDGAGHFPWIERPGAIRAALDRLAGR
jgi:proline iminopeptidase